MKKNPHTRLFSHYPLLQLSLAYSAGVIYSKSFHFQTASYLFLTFLFGFIGVLTLGFRRLTPGGVPMLLAFTWAGACLFQIEGSAIHESSVKQLLNRDIIIAETSTIVTGTLNGPPEFASDRLYLVIDVEEISTNRFKRPATGVVSLMANFKTPANRDEYRQLNLQYGSRVQVFTTLNRSEKYRNPGVSSISEYLDRKNYDATGIVKSPASIVKLSEPTGLRPLSWLYLWRAAVQSQIDQKFSAETAGVLDAALLGNRYNLSKSTSERFREAGTFHVLVISGLHISFIGGLAFLIMRRLTRRRIFQFVMSNLVVWGYTFAVGAEASVSRAALMFTVLTFGSVVFRPTSALNSLGGAALILLINSPKDLFDPSLQLTFLSVLAIVTLAWPLLQNFKAIGSWRPTRETPYPPACHSSLKTLCESLYWSERYWKTELERMPHQYRLFKSPWAARLERVHLQRPLRYVFSSIVVSISVQAVLLPFLIVYFHRVSMASIVLNVVVSLLLALLSAVAIVGVLLSQVSSVLAHPFIMFADELNWLMTHSVDPFSQFLAASVRVCEYSGRGVWVYVLYCVPLVVLMTSVTHWCPLASPRISTPQPGKIVFVALLTFLPLLGLVLFHPLSAGRPDGNLHVDFLDVGQGDSALITMPDGSTLLVDGGGRPTFRSNNSSSESLERETGNIGERVVSEYLWWRGLDHVDYVLATHADADHMDGLNDVVRNFDVRAGLVGRRPSDDPEFTKFAQTLQSWKTPIEVVGAGDELQFGSVKLKVLWPPPTDQASAPSRNNDSIVLLLKFGERALLLTGDVEKEAESQLLATYKDLKVDVVKVPHHGSRTSSTENFVMATSPRYAIISVGRTSMFGHPHPEVVERWKRQGAEILTTGASGTISVTTNGKELWLSKFVQDDP